MQAPATPPPEPGSFAPAPRRQSTAGRELFIGRLSWDTVEDDLRDLFASVGPVEKAVIITDRDTGRSRGFGFVTMGDEKAAARAIEELDGAELDGRAIRVRIAESR
ncbi:MAG: RNA-binding protein [Myxococcales bacterium]|nr:RNA-binding protein [Myxococcales bacterium]